MENGRDPQIRRRKLDAKGKKSSSYFFIANQTGTQVVTDVITLESSEESPASNSLGVDGNGPGPSSALPAPTREDIDGNHRVSDNQPVQMREEENGTSWDALILKLSPRSRDYVLGTGNSSPRIAYDYDTDEEEKELVICEEEDVVEKTTNRAAICNHDKDTGELNHENTELTTMEQNSESIETEVDQADERNAVETTVSSIDIVSEQEEQTNPTLDRTPDHSIEKWTYINALITDIHEDFMREGREDTVAERIEASSEPGETQVISISHPTNSEKHQLLPFSIDALLGPEETTIIDDSSNVHVAGASTTSQDTIMVVDEGVETSQPELAREGNDQFAMEDWRSGPSISRDPIVNENRQDGQPHFSEGQVVQVNAQLEEMDRIGESVCEPDVSTVYSWMLEGFNPMELSTSSQGRDLSETRNAELAEVNPSEEANAIETRRRESAMVIDHFFSQPWPSDSQNYTMTTRRDSEMMDFQVVEPVEEEETQNSQSSDTPPHRCRSCFAYKNQNHVLKKPSGDLLKKIYGLPIERWFYVCFRCATAFPNPVWLEKHGQLHSEDRICPECAGTALNGQLMKTHIRRHEKIDGFVAICTVCRVQYAKEGELLQHLVNIHGVQMAYVCKGCRVGTCQLDRNFALHISNCELLKKPEDPVTLINNLVAIMPAASLSYQADRTHFTLASEHPELIAPVSSCRERSLIRSGDGVFTCPEVCQNDGNNPCSVLTHFVWKREELMSGSTIPVIGEVDHQYFDQNGGQLRSYGARNPIDIYNRFLEHSMDCGVLPRTFSNGIDNLGQAVPPATELPTSSVSSRRIEDQPDELSAEETQTLKPGSSKSCRPSTSNMVQQPSDPSSLPNARGSTKKSRTVEAERMRRSQAKKKLNEKAIARNREQRIANMILLDTAPKPDVPPKIHLSGFLTTMNQTRGSGILSMPSTSIAIPANFQTIPFHRIIPNFPSTSMETVSASQNTSKRKRNETELLEYCAICRCPVDRFCTTNGVLMIQMSVDPPSEWMLRYAQQLRIQRNIGRFPAEILRKTLKRGSYICVMHFNPHAYQLNNNVSIELLSIENNAPMLNIMEQEEVGRDFIPLMNQFLESLYNSQPFSLPTSQSIHEQLKGFMKCQHSECNREITDSLSLSLHNCHNWENVVFCAVCFHAEPMSSMSLTDRMMDHLKLHHGASQMNNTVLKREIEYWFYDPAVMPVTRNQLQDFFVKLKFMCLICGQEENYMSTMKCHLQLEHTVVREGKCKKCNVYFGPAHCEKHILTIMFPLVVDDNGNLK